MNKSGITIRTVTPDDGEELLAIYAPYVIKTAITFEYEVPTPAEFRKRISHTLSRYPYIAAVGENEILGYAYTGSFVGRPAYDWSAETTIYISENKRKLGLGGYLYGVIEDISRAQHITNLNACIGFTETEDEFLTGNSVEFHEHLGYDRVGEFHKCGFKFGRWYNMVWMEKMIGDHDGKPLPMIPFPELDSDLLESLGIMTGGGK